jgi:hypothetical protein
MATLQCGIVGKRYRVDIEVIRSNLTDEDPIDIWFSTKRHAQKGFPVWLTLTRDEAMRLAAELIANKKPA